LTDPAQHTVVVYILFGLAAVTAVALLFVVAPYGRHQRTGWGPTLTSRLGWVIMECPASIGFAAIFAFGAHRSDAVPLVLLGLWQLHYLQRTFVYPLRIREGRKRIPLLIVTLGFSFNGLNAWVNAVWVADLGTYSNSWFSDPRFVAGAALFFAGMSLNLHSDAILRRLRAPGEDGYAIPFGGGFRWVSCPNYLGEILEWSGWALATWSLAGLAFAVYTLANLAPRALANHRWYRDRFRDYPVGRRALFPFLL